jgi:hypothetical protein
LRYHGDVLELDRISQDPEQSFVCS